MDLHSRLEFNKERLSSLLRALLLGQREIFTGDKHLTMFATLSPNMLSVEIVLAGE